MSNPENGFDNEMATVATARGYVKDTTTKKLTIVEKSERLSAVIEELSRTTHELIRRIDPVLTPDDVNEKADGTSPSADKPTLSSYASYLEIQTKDLQRLLYQVEDALGRLEL